MYSRNGNNTDKKSINKMMLAITAWEILRSYKFFEELIGTRDSVKIFRLGAEPELEYTTLLLHNIYCVMIILIFTIITITVQNCDY